MSKTAFEMMRNRQYSSIKQSGRLEYHGAAIISDNSEPKIEPKQNNSGSNFDPVGDTKCVPKRARSQS